MPLEKGETSEGVLKNVTSMCEEADLDIPDVAIYRAHRIGNQHVGNSKNVKCKSIIVRFTTFRHRKRFYHAKKNVLKGSKIKLDLTKKRHNLQAEANKYCDGSIIVKFCCTDVNCRLKVKWAYEKEDGTFFSCMDDLIQMAL